MDLTLPAIRAAFEAHLAIHAAIAILLLAGLSIAAFQWAALRPVRHWVEQTSRGFAVKEPPALIAALARVLSGKEREGFVLSLGGMGTLLGLLRRRLEETRRFPNGVLAGLAFLTLLGAFWGAAQFGVAALVLFALAYAALRGAQDRMLRQVEDFLAQRAELPSSLLGGESALPAYLEALLKQTAENLAEIQRAMTRSEDERRAMQSALASLTETLSAVSDQLRAQQKVILALSKNHYDLQPAMADLATQVTQALAGSDEMRNHLRSLDLAVARLVDEVSAARAQAPEAMRQEIKVLAATLARNGDRPHFSANGDGPHFRER